MNNYSFDAVYGEPRSTLDQFLAQRPARRAFDQTRHWLITGGSLASCSDGAVVPGAWFGRVTSTGRGVLINNGYPDERPGIPTRPGAALEFSALVRSTDFDGTLTVELVDPSGIAVASATLPAPGAGWTRVSARLEPSSEVMAALHVGFVGRGATATAPIDDGSLVARLAPHAIQAPLRP